MNRPSSARDYHRHAMAASRMGHARQGAHYDRIAARLRVIERRERRAADRARTLGVAA